MKSKNTWSFCRDVCTVSQTLSLTLGGCLVQIPALKQHLNLDWVTYNISKMHLQNFPKRRFHNLASLSNLFCCRTVLSLKILSLVLYQNLHTYELHTFKLLLHIKGNPPTPSLPDSFCRVRIHPSLSSHHSSCSATWRLTPMMPSAWSSSSSCLFPTHKNPI